MQDAKLNRSMGLWMATALVVGNMIGSMLALVFARRGRTFPRTGGPYPYSTGGFAATGALDEAADLLADTAGTVVVPDA